MVRIRDKMADIAASLYLLAGRFNCPAFVLDFLHQFCRWLDPVKVPPDCINPAMLRGISRRIGITVEKQFEDDI